MRCPGLRGIEAIIDALAEQRDQLLFAAIERAAELGVEPFTLQAIVRVGGSQGCSTAPRPRGSARRPCASCRPSRLRTG